MASERIERIRKILETDAKSEFLWFSLGKAYMAEGFPAEAAEAFGHAVAIKPNYTAVYEDLGRALEAAGRRAEAIEAYRKGVAVGQDTRDIIPLERMTARLRRLERESPPPSAA